MGGCFRSKARSAGVPAGRRCALVTVSQPCGLHECGPHPVAQDYHIVTMSLGADGGARPGEEPLPVDRRVPAVRLSKEGQP